MKLRTFPGEIRSIATLVLRYNKHAQDKGMDGVVETMLDVTTRMAQELVKEGKDHTWGGTGGWNVNLWVARDSDGNTFIDSEYSLASYLFDSDYEHRMIEL